MVLLTLAVAAPASAKTVTPHRTATPTAPSTSPAPPPPPKAWILVDATTGNVIDAGNERTPLPPASLTKVLTAITAINALPPATDVPVSARAEAAPADKLFMKQGQVWTLDQMLHSLLISSANDAAVALAEQAGGTVEGFQRMFADTAANLGMADHPLLMDPAGLDGPAGVNGGNLISARDLAIAGRSLLANVTLAQIVATPVYYFPGPDNVQHRLTNHNKPFLTAYPGAIGIKTGFTNRAGECRIEAATRDGRTMLAVVMNGANPNQTAMTLLDKGFATPVTAESAAGQLPAVTSGLPKPVAPPTTASSQAAAAGAPQAPAHKSSRASTLDSITSSWPARVAVVVLGLMALAAARSLTRRKPTPQYRQRAGGGRRAA